MRQTYSDKEELRCSDSSTVYCYSSCGRQEGTLHTAHTVVRAPRQPLPHLRRAPSSPAQRGSLPLPTLDTQYKTATEVSAASGPRPPPTAQLQPLPPAGSLPTSSHSNFRFHTECFSHILRTTNPPASLPVTHSFRPRPFRWLKDS